MAKQLNKLMNKFKKNHCKTGVITDKKYHMMEKFCSCGISKFLVKKKERKKKV